LNHIKQGDEIALDIKIGIIHILSDNRLMFRNYNPEVKLDNLKKNNNGKSSRSKAPSSVLTPCTNVESTLSYRVSSVDVPARHIFNHVGIKRSGPAVDYCLDHEAIDNEKLYYRHKKNPFSHLNSFIEEEKFKLENKISHKR
jgi:hypothetical protein